jgi:L-threonylcarbamoyladenylate synthase
LINSENSDKKRVLKMDTKFLVVDKDGHNVQSYSQAVELLKNGEVVAFPTETVYGLGAVATNDEAVKKIYVAKGRPSDNPLIVHIGTKEELANYVEHIPAIAQTCIDAFWPGPLTLILQAKQNLFAPSVTKLPTVGFRMPDHPVALELLQKLQLPVAAPSANRSGKPSPTKASHVMEDLQGHIAAVVDGGETGIGLESTVLDVTLEVPTILRPGGVTKEMLESVIGPVNAPKMEEQEAGVAPKAPGMKYTHYAPNAPVYLVKPDKKIIEQAVTKLIESGEQVALIAPNELHYTLIKYNFSVGDMNDLQAHSALLYDALRGCDKTDATVILATTTTYEGVGAAIMNRLEKAAVGYFSF